MPASRVTAGSRRVAASPKPCPSRRITSGVTQTLHARSDGEFEPDAYTARHLLVLEGLEAVRKRPGMYIGSTDSRGLMHCLWEIIDNAVDEALGGHCTRIEVDAARRRLGRGARRRPRHPGRHRAARPG